MVTVRKLATGSCSALRSSPARPIGTGIEILRLGDMCDDVYASYFADREHFERDMSNHTADPKVAAVHAELADRYEALAVVFGVKRAAASQIGA